MDKQAKIFVAGHRGMVGSAIVRTLQAAGFTNLVLRTSKELDLRNQQAVESFFLAEKPEYVFLAAATVGGIVANSTYPADFIYDNLAIQINVIHQAWLKGTKRLLFLGSTCIYPKLAPQPIKEEYLLTGPLEPTNDAYAMANIAGICQCRSYNRQYGTRFLAAMPNNLYGPNDNFDLEKSHVLPALIRKCHEAKQAGASSVTIWGSGSPLREFLHVDDLADAVAFVIENYSDEGPLNVGTGRDISIIELATLIGEVLGWKGEFVLDESRPDGMKQKLLDVSRLRDLGWSSRIELRDGIATTYADYLARDELIGVER
jgi:GDP-L-fucose synthase